VKGTVPMSLILYLPSGVVSHTRATVPVVAVEDRRAASELPATDDATPAAARIVVLRAMSDRRPGRRSCLCHQRRVSNAPTNEASATSVVSATLPPTRFSTRSRPRVRRCAGKMLHRIARRRRGAGCVKVNHGGAGGFTAQISVRGVGGWPWGDDFVPRGARKPSRASFPPAFGA
jgi:hypothetical protein